MVDVIDCFAGPGGWSVGLDHLGLTEVGIEWDHDACQTARAAGFLRVQADVTLLDPHTVAADHAWNGRGYIASPPCQAWSMAGKRGGEHDRAACHELADRMAAGDDSLDFTNWADARSHLICQPVRWVRELNPDWIALEEVPRVIDLWNHFATIFRSWGYSVAVGVLNCEQYGVPQTRRRAFLIASRTRDAALPPRTHSRYYAANRAKLDPGVAQWVSMADVLGVGFADRPSPTINAGGGTTGGPEPIANIALRRQLSATPGWIERGQQTTGSRQNFTWVTGDEYPVLTSQEAGVLQTFPHDYPWSGIKTKRYEQVGNAVPPLLAAVVIGQLV